jgi:hypothetical protein
VPENIKSLQASVIARLKIMARLDIAEKRLPQDGRINLELDGLAIDVRVATIPSVEGESISLRLLAQQQVTVNRLGLTDNIRPVVDELLKLPNGIILITGPDWQRQIDHALRLPHRAQSDASPHRHHRRSGRIQDARHRADRREARDRPHLWCGPAQHSAWRSERRDDRRNARPGNHRDRRARRT